LVRLRLRRVGAKRQPSYRIVAADSESPRDGRFIEVVGFYNPRTDPTTLEINEARALYWLSVGAQPSDTVKRLLNNNGTWDRFERLRQGESIEALAAEVEGESAEATESQTEESPESEEVEEVTEETQEFEEEEAEAPVA
jgi:small subunit ribosomal protein S16